MDKIIVYTELVSSQHANVDTLFRIYAKNKFHARVYFMNEVKSTFTRNRVGVFDEPNGDFTIVSFVRKFGISKTNKMYNRESKEFSIIKKGNKFYYKRKNIILPLVYNHILGLPISYKIIINELVNRLPWFRYMTEHDVCRKVSFNTLVSKKIFSLEKALKHEYKLNGPTSKELYKIKNDHRTRSIKYYVEYLDNAENLCNTLGTYDFSTFYDTLKMAKILDRRVNCSWSARRLKEEHDKWAKEITDIVFVEGDRPMSVNQIFIKFSEMSGFKLLKTTKEMNYEGRKNNHCVATYVSNVDSGQSGIYSIDDYTLELVNTWSIDHSKPELKINQFRGYSNCEAPSDLFDLVKSKLDEMNLMVQLLTMGVR
jgi:hypothetical protein